MKFGYDKRLPHYSSLIKAGQLTREKAIELLKEPLYSEVELKNDFIFVAKKLGLKTQELESYVHNEKRFYSEFKNWDSIGRKLKRLRDLVQKVLRRKIEFRY